MGCQKNIAEKIRKQDGDYLFAVKKNQGKLYRAIIEEAFPINRLNDLDLESFVTEEKGHGRKKVRLHVVSDIPNELLDFTFA